MGMSNGDLRSLMADWRDDLIWISSRPDHMAIVTIDRVENLFKYSYVHFHGMEWKDEIADVCIDSPVTPSEYKEGLKEWGFES